MQRAASSHARVTAASLQQPLSPVDTSSHDDSIMMINHKYFGVCWTARKQSPAALGSVLTCDMLESRLNEANIHIELLAAPEEDEEICFGDAFSEAANRELRSICHAIMQEQAAVHERISDRLSTVQPLVEQGLLALSWLDVAYAFAGFSVECAYIRPVIIQSPNGAPVFDVRGGRHPIQELLVPQFFPNTITLACEQEQQAAAGSIHENQRQLPHAACLIIAGANSSGKSVLLKQAGLMQVLAQAGCFVPATSARMTPSNGIYTRIATSDK